MKLAWLKTAGKLAVKGTKIIKAVVAAANAVEAISAKKGPDKLGEALLLFEPTLLAAGLGDRVNLPHVRDAVQQTIEAYVAAQNARVAADAALAQFVEAKTALERVIADAKQ